MKKFLSVLMIAAMTTAVFAGCSSSAEEETTTEGTEQTEETTGEADYSGVTLTLCTWGGSTGAATQELVKDFVETLKTMLFIFQELTLNRARHLAFLRRSTQML